MLKQMNYFDRTRNLWGEERWVFFSAENHETSGGPQVEKAEEDPLAGYRVEGGDTLSKIANRFKPEDMSSSAALKIVIASNPQIKNPNLIQIGEFVKLPLLPKGPLYDPEKGIKQVEKQQAKVPKIHAEEEKEHKEAESKADTIVAEINRLTQEGPVPGDLRKAEDEEWSDSGEKKKDESGDLAGKAEGVGKERKGGGNLDEVGQGIEPKKKRGLFRFLFRGGHKKSVAEKQAKREEKRAGRAERKAERARKKMEEERSWLSSRNSSKLEGLSRESLREIAQADEVRAEWKGKSMRKADTIREGVVGGEMSLVFYKNGEKLCDVKMRYGGSKKLAAYLTENKEAGARTLNALKKGHLKGERIEIGDLKVDEDRDTLKIKCKRVTSQNLNRIKGNAALEIRNQKTGKTASFPLEGVNREETVFKLSDIKKEVPFGEDHVTARVVYEDLFGNQIVSSRLPAVQEG